MSIKPFQLTLPVMLDRPKSSAYSVNRCRISVLTDPKKKVSLLLWNAS